MLDIKMVKSKQKMKLKMVNGALVEQHTAVAEDHFNKK